MTMKNPPHPGRAIRDDCLDPLGLTVSAAAEMLQVDANEFSRVINGEARISLVLAVRLEEAGWGDAETWLKMQSAHDEANAES